MRLSALLLVGSALSPLGMTVAYAQSSGPAVSARAFDIKAQPLVDAMREFSRTTGIQVVYTASVGSGVFSGGVSGSLSAGEALSRLLSGTGLTFRYTGPNAVTLEPAPRSADGTVQLGPVRVEGAEGSGSALLGTSVSDPTSTEGTKSYAAAYGSTGSKTASSLRETPQSISIITRQRIEDQELTTIHDVLNQTTGITVFEGTMINSSYLSRGFQITSARKDGGAAIDTPNGIDADMAFYDHVEVLRGSDGLFGAAGEPSGTINLVRKKPTANRQVIGQVQVGSWNNYRGEADISGPLGFNGAVRGRAVAAYHSKDFFQKGADMNRTLLYGVLEADLSPTTLLRVGGSYDDIDTSNIGYGLSRTKTGEEIPLSRRLYVTGKDDGEKTKRWEFFARLEQSLGADWKITADVTFNGYKQRRSAHFFYGAVDADTGAGYGGTYGLYHENRRNRSVDAALSGKFDLFGRSHDLLVGGTWSFIGQRADSYLVPGNPYIAVPNIYDFNANDYPEPTTLYHFAHFPMAGQDNKGLYGSLNFELADGLHLIGGGRVSWYKTSYETYRYNVAGEQISHSYSRSDESGIVTPYAAITYDVAKDWTVYASFAQTYKSQSDSFAGPLPGTPLPPVRGKTYEAGVKGELADGRMTATAALYRIERNGEAVQDPAYDYTSGSLGTSCCYLAQGLIRSQGVDTEISGEILPGWQMTVGYTFNENKNRRNQVRYSTLTPKHLVKLFTSYRLAGALSGLTIGGGVTAQSASSRQDYAYVRDSNGNVTTDTITAQITQKGYSVWNTFATYAVNDNVTLSGNLNNIFDKRYFSTVGYLDYGNWYGAPRNFLVTLRAKY